MNIEDRAKQVNSEITALIRKNQYKEAFQIANELHELCQNENYEFGKLLAMQKLAVIHYDQAEYDISLKYLMDIVEKLDLYSDEELAFSVYNNLAVLYIRQESYKEAEVLLKKSVERAKHNFYHHVIYFNNLAHIYLNTNRLKQAQKYLDSAYQLAQRENYSELLKDIIINYGKLNYQLGNYSQVTEDILGLIDSFSMKEEEVETVVEAYLLLGKTYLAIRNYDECIAYCDTSFIFAKRNKLNFHMRDTLFTLAEAHHNNGNDEKAYEYLLQFVEIDAKISNESKEKRIAQLQLEFDLKNRVKENKLLTRKNTELTDKNAEIKMQQKELMKLNKKLVEQNEELIRVNTIDYLTGIYNRRHLMQEFVKYFEKVYNTSDRMCCIMFDIDYFKQINDNYGHLFGDFVLKETVNRISKLIPTDCVFGRLGGDEFVIILPYASIEEAAAISGNIISQVYSRPYDNKTIRTRVSLSVGITDNHINRPLSVEEMIHYADQALYNVKTSGRNGYQIAQS